MIAPEDGSPVQSGAWSGAWSGAAQAPLIEPTPLPAVTVGMLTRRAAQIGWVAVRHLASFPRRRRRAVRGAPALQVMGPSLRSAAEELGVTFVKLGQLLASSPSVAGEHLSDAMRGLLDNGPAVDFPELRRVVEEDLGATFDTVFSQFDPHPHAAASLAVVHRARLADGRPVAVKILRPGADRAVAADLAIISRAFRFLARQLPVGMVASLPGAVEGLAEQLAEELDLRNEARSMEWFRDLMEVIGVGGVRIPSVYAAASGRRVLTMEFIAGHPVDDLSAVERLGIDARRALEDLLHAWFAVTLCTGTFHGDMHAGNLLFTEEGPVALLDWGILGRMSPESRHFLRRSIEGALGDESAWADVRAHVMPSMGADVTRLTGMSEDEVFAMVRAQIEAIMTAPFRDLNLMALAPTSATVSGGAEVVGGSRRARLARVLAERRRVRGLGGLPDRPVDRGELLLVKQLVFFERHGKMFLADSPLIWDRAVFQALLALPESGPGYAGPRPIGSDHRASDDAELEEVIAT